MHFDNDDRLNDDGTVTIKVVPSNWHVFNISPDTYHLFSLDGEDERHLEWCEEETGMEIGWDDLEWDYDHASIVKDLAHECMNWIMEKLMEFGLESASNPSVVDTWSPAYYNFTSDGFEMEFTCDPKELRSLTENFDVDEWARKNYSSCDGFISYVTGRMNDPEWHAQYDGEFRIEYLLHTNDTEGSWSSLRDEWVTYVYESLSEIAMNHTTVTPDMDVFSEGHHIARVNADGATVRYHDGEGWCSDDDYDDSWKPILFYDNLLDYHREECKLVGLVRPVTIDPAVQPALAI